MRIAVPCGRELARLPGPFVDRMFEDLDARTRRAILLVDFLARTHSLATGRHDSMVSA
jgi:hypothetical protein